MTVVIAAIGLFTAGGADRIDGGRAGHPVLTRSAAHSRSR